MSSGGIDELGYTDWGLLGEQGFVHHVICTAAWMRLSLVSHRNMVTKTVKVWGGIMSIIEMGLADSYFKRILFLKVKSQMYC